MPALTFEAARACVLEKVTPRAGCEIVALDDAAGRILAEPLDADRDYPAAARSIRDGFAVRSADTPGRLRLAGEVRAGQILEAALNPGECVEIMTGAPVPPGADAVVMLEHVTRDGDHIHAPAAAPGQFINPQGAEARQGDRLLDPGRPIGYAEVALLAAAGRGRVAVYRKPRVAIVATGDEIVEIDETPSAHQIRNSNAHSLAAQVRRAGGLPVIFPIARDTREATRAILEKALDCDLVLLSGGVSAGKYDIVEPVLASLGAEFYFDRVLIQPGQPLVFGRAGAAFFFGLPGNPASTMVTFEIFARAALERLAGRREPELHFTLARLAAPFKHKPGLTRFLPASLGPAGLMPIPWRGSSDVPAMARTNAFLVADSDRESWAAGDLIRVLLK